MITILQGDCLEKLRELPDGSVHCCVTSPPYWGLRDYGVSGQIGLEKTPEEYVAKMVEVFREVRRVLREDGTCWANFGDTYASQGGRFDPKDWDNKQSTNRGSSEKARRSPSGLKPKDLCMIPARVALALQADGWYLRSEIIWAKRNCMPESVEDRPTKSHEQIFLLSKNERYFYDAEAVKQPASEAYVNDSRWDTGSTEFNYKDGYAEAMAQNPKMPHRVFNGERRTTANLRDVWLLTTEPYSESHFATFPTDIPRRAILAGTSAKGCCPKCGAPWERMVTGECDMAARYERGEPKRHGLDGAAASGASNVGAFSASKITSGWRPTCTGHIAAYKPIPCTVLDPFGGSGTTGQVALELGRKAILIELNPKYIPLIEKRTFVTPGFQLA